MPIFAVILPLILLVIFGIINGNSLAYEGANYTYITNQFPAIISVSIIAGGLMGLPLLILDYREKKILKRMKATPVSPSIILLTSISMYFIYAITSLILSSILGLLIFNVECKGNIFVFLGTYMIVFISMFSIGSF